jgi:hypothetical protein
MRSEGEVRSAECTVKVKCAVPGVVRSISEEGWPGIALDLWK